MSRIPEDSSPYVHQTVLGTHKGQSTECTVCSALFKSSTACKHCGVTDGSAAEFRHVNGLCLI